MLTIFRKTQVRHHSTYDDTLYARRPIKDERNSKYWNASQIYNDTSLATGSPASGYASLQGQSGMDNSGWDMELSLCCCM